LSGGLVDKRYQVFVSSTFADRYGSLTPEGISYTEQGYEYAISIGLKVLVFIHAAPDEIPVGKSDVDPSVHKKLDAFASVYLEVASSSFGAKPTNSRAW
jgi:hypothetical protein